MAATDLAIRIATTLDSSGINRASKAVVKLERSVKRLSGTFGLLSVGYFAKNSLKAFVADELAATKLTNAVKNLGLEFANPYITNYIAALEKSSQVADDQLRPAFQRLLQQTGSIAKSQSILNTAIEVSRGSTESLGTVTEDLAKAYYGQTRSLRKYSLGLTQVELQTKSFSELQDILAKKFQGSSATYLNTYAGQLDVLSLAWQNLQENAGKALFTLAGASGDQSSGAKRLGGIVDAFGTGLVSFAQLLNNAATSFAQAYFGLAPTKNAPAPAPVKGQELFLKSSGNDAKLRAIEAQQAKLYKQQMAASKAITDQQKKQASLKKSGSVFDMEQIQRIAALKGKLSEEDRLRVEAQLALLNDNDVLAKKLTDQILDAQDKSGQLKAYFYSIGDTKIKNPFDFLDTWLEDFQTKLNSLKFPNFSMDQSGLAPDLAAIGVIAGYGDYAGSVVNQSPNDLGNGLYGMQSRNLPVSTGGGGGNTFNTITVNGSILTDQMLTDLIQNGLQGASLSGSPSQIGRIQGMFGG